MTDTTGALSAVVHGVDVLRRLPCSEMQHEAREALDELVGRLDEKRRRSSIYYISKVASLNRLFGNHGGGNLGVWPRSP